MKSFIYFYTIIVLLFFMSCQKSAIEESEKGDDNESITIDSIAINLSKIGSSDPELLIGEWYCVKFAFTEDGKNISDVADISNGTLKIPYAPTPEEQNIEELWRFEYSYYNRFVCSLTDNFIKLKLFYPSYTSTQEEKEIINSLINSYSFIINNNELIIYFTGLKNKNILILKKKDNIDPYTAIIGKWELFRLLNYGPYQDVEYTPTGYVEYMADGKFYWYDYIDDKYNLNGVKFWISEWPSLPNIKDRWVLHYERLVFEIENPKYEHYRDKPLGHNFELKMLNIDTKSLFQLDANTLVRDFNYIYRRIE